MDQLQRDPLMEEIIIMAKVCHQANKAWCESAGDMSQPDWEDAPAWQQTSAIQGVHYRLSNPGAKDADMHNSWLAEKEKDGWKYGPVKNPETKEHPCFVPYEQLPLHDRKKDRLFSAIVDALSGLKAE